MVSSKADTFANESNIDIRSIQARDLPAISALHAEAFGPGRFARIAYRVREGTPNLSAHCRAGWRGAVLAGAVTMTEITIGDAPVSHWLLGPLAVRAGNTGKGIGRRLVLDVLQSVGSGSQMATVVLVGDLDYYGQLGFEAVPRGKIALPGPVDPSRLLIWRGADGTREVPGGTIRVSSALGASN